MMTQKTVLSVGQCRPDGAAISHFLTTNFDVTLLTADLADQALAGVREYNPDLVLINRVLDADGSDGMQILKAILSQPETRDVPVMLVSNYADWQQKAIELGACPGFGKAQLNSAAARERVSAALGLQTPLAGKCSESE